MPSVVLMICSVGTWMPTVPLLKPSSHSEQPRCIAPRLQHLTAAPFHAEQYVNLANCELASQMIAPKAWRSRGWHHLRKSEGRNRNIALHKDELSESKGMGFRRAAAAVPVNQPTESWMVSRKALGMGCDCPFDSDELIFAAQQTLSISECEMLRNEASSLLSTGAQYVYTLASTVREVAVHQLPGALEWFNAQGLPRLASLAAQCFPSVVSDPTELWVYDALIINYDADSFELPHTPVHRDSSMITLVIPLAGQHEYTGGGTYIEAIDQSITLDQGCALIHASGLRHGGFPITSGKRWVLAVFLNPTKMPLAEHGRRFHNRATWIAQTLYGEVLGRRGRAPEKHVLDERERERLEDELRECYAFALEETGGNDFEIFVNVARHALKEKKPEEALLLLQRAAELNPREATVAIHRGLAYEQLGRLRDAFDSYRSAAHLNPRNPRGRLNAVELCLAHGAATVLGETSQGAADELYRFAEELHAAGELK